MEKLEQIGEHEAIRRLSGMLGKHEGLIIGAGDDCAVCAFSDEQDQVFTTDPVIEGIHFAAGENPERVGNKAAGRILSDIAAMGGQPQWILVNVVATPQQDVAFLERVYQGMTALCHRFGATIIGGDLAEGSCLELHLFGTGVLPSGSALLRSGARAGDAIFVTGRLGCSRDGKHLDFLPRVDEGIFLRQSGRVTSMMDISDGLATDLRHILEQSQVGAVLNADGIPSEGSLDEALYDGEDFELLFTLPPDGQDTFLAEWIARFDAAPVQVGSIIAESGQLMLKKNDGKMIRLEDKAYEHFSTDSRR